jgi:hypothetical protein
MTPDESAEQAAFVQWAYLYRIAGEGIPLSATLGTYLFSIPNGGLRDIGTAQILRKEGQKAGVYDLYFALPRGRYHGAFIEMKAIDGVLSEEQKHFANVMRGVGYLCCECFTQEQARIEMQRYLQLGPYDGRR